MATIRDNEAAIRALMDSFAGYNLIRRNLFMTGHPLCP